MVDKRIIVVADYALGLGALEIGLTQFTAFSLMDLVTKIPIPQIVPIAAGIVGAAGIMKLAQITGLMK